eukprot:3862888-Pyramimonas_sp.AAC.1
MESYSQDLAFSQWAEEQYTTAPGKLFRRIKDVPSAGGEGEKGQNISFDPHAAMDTRASVWREK